MPSESMNECMYSSVEERLRCYNSRDISGWTGKFITNSQESIYQTWLKSRFVENPIDFDAQNIFCRSN